MFYDIVRYIEGAFCASVAEKVVPPLLYSGILQKYHDLEAFSFTRYRVNVMLTWEYGYFKSTILEKVASWLPSECRLLTSSSAAAIRGSFIKGVFFAPELLLSDVLIVPELSSMLRSDDETIGALLVALEEANIRVSLVKGGNLSSDQMLRVEAYGAEIREDRLCYRNKAAIWAATHTVDNIPDAMRDAFLSRFYVAHVASDEIPEDAAWRDPRDVFDAAFERDVSQWMRDRWDAAPPAPDHAFANEVLAILRGGAGGRVNPRVVGDLRRMAMAHHLLVPGEGAAAAAAWLSRYLSAYAGLTTREMIAQYIYQSPRTLAEILEFTGQRKANVLGHLKRMGASRRGANPIQYYVDSFGGGK